MSKQNNKRQKRPSQTLAIPYAKEQSSIFGFVHRPKIDIQIYSKTLSAWVSVEQVLTDTGADVSILPKSLGVLLVGNIRKGKRVRITGFITGSTKYIHLHELKARISNIQINGLFAIASTDDVPPTLGRIGTLDKLNIVYRKGRQLIISK